MEAGSKNRYTSINYGIASCASSVEYGFTFIELLAVLAIISMLSTLLIPAMAGMRSSTARMQCQANLRQIGNGIGLFEQDHNSMFPPAGLSTGASSPSSAQITWDTYINHYIGGTASDSFLSSGVMPIELSPPILRCPTDTLPKANWVGTWLGIRSYVMIAAGLDYSTGWQVDTRNGAYPLPTLQMGVGVYWANAPTPDWNARSYKTSVLKDPAGTILLVEQPNGAGVGGNIWPCLSLGPTVINNSGLTALYQLDPHQPVQNPNSSTAMNQGWHTYVAHGYRFNYLFHDNHVEPLPYDQTLGTGTVTLPKGMWTVATGD
jgi:prepilin-type N-terminal cleavage/methylation domain-containing protein